MNKLTAFSKMHDESFHFTLKLPHNYKKKNHKKDKIRVKYSEIV